MVPWSVPSRAPFTQRGGRSREPPDSRPCRPSGGVYTAINSGGGFKGQKFNGSLSELITVNSSASKSYSATVHRTFMIVCRITVGTTKNTSTGYGTKTESFVQLFVPEGKYSGSTSDEYTSTFRGHLRSPAYFVTSTQAASASSRSYSNWLFSIYIDLSDLKVYSASISSFADSLSSGDEVSNYTIYI